MKFKGLFLDLDGTILNTIEDIKESVNFSLKLHGIKPRSLEQIRKSIGHGSKHLINTSIPNTIDQKQFETIFNSYKNYYVSHVDVFTKPYDGVVDTLKELKNRGVKIAVITNKPIDLALPLINKYFQGLIDVVYGQDKNSIPKPNPVDIFKALEKLNLTKEEIIYVGDSLVDYQTAINANVKPILCSYGFEKKDILKANSNCELIDKFDELRRYFIWTFYFSFSQKQNALI